MWGVIQSILSDKLLRSSSSNWLRLKLSLKFENIPIKNAVQVFDLSDWEARLDFGGVSMEVHPSDE